LYASILLILILYVTGAAPAFAEATAEDPREPRGAEDFGSQEAVPLIPEPMVFDMVRGLGAEKGEFEANVLAEIPVDESSARSVYWAPEIEFAVRDGLALEFELPFEDNHLEAYKFALQYTFGTAFERRFIHGTQFIAEALNGVEITELTLLYIPAMRLDEIWCFLAMLGFRTEVGGESEDGAEALVNVSLFADVGPEVTIGIESNYASGLALGSTLLVMPQVHYEFTDHWMIQAGLGAGFLPGESDITFALRLICSW
jgi:hypothetical protein